MRFGLALLVACIPVVALAAPHSAKDCAAIENPFAYNQCLASFGPKVGQQNYQPAPGASQGLVQGGRVGRAYSTTAQAKAGGAAFVRRTSNGRFIAEFQVAPRAPANIKPWRHRHYRR